MVVKPQYENAEWYSNGMVAVKVGDKWGFIDKSGNMVIKPQFDDAWHFVLIK